MAEQTPVSGERVMLPPARSVFRRSPQKLTPEETNAGRRAGYRRSNWERSPRGVERTKDITALTDQKTPVGQQHFMRNYDRPEHSGPRVYDTQLPGMADPNAAPRPPRWDELTPEARTHTERALRRFGTSVDRMASDLGAQYDQAVVRAERHGTTPFSEEFYSRGEPRQVVERSAHELGIPLTIHAQMNAFTSPNTKFSQKVGTGAERRTVYPNDTAAKHAVRFVQQGGDPEKITNELSTTGSGDKRAQGYVTNLRKAAVTFKQHTQGVAPADWVTSASGVKGGPFNASPKTGPYANSWSDSHPQFFVSDVHSGGGGALPHLSSAKPMRLGADGEPLRDSKGREKREKSERERAIETVPFFHTAADEAARRAMGARNLGHVREFQAAQWGEEQLQRGEGPDNVSQRGFPKEREVYGKANTEVAGQTEMWRSSYGREFPNFDAIATAQRQGEQRSSFAQRTGLEF